MFCENFFISLIFTNEFLKWDIFIDFPLLFLLNGFILFLVKLEYCHVDFNMSQPFLLLIDFGLLFNFRLLQKLDFPTMKFSLYFLAYEEKNDIPKDKDEKIAWVFSRKATLELTQWVSIFIFLYSLHFYKPSFLTYKLN